MSPTPSLLNAALRCFALALMAAAPCCADDAQDLASRIDKHLDERWKSDGITPAPQSDDGEFLRRVGLHIGGSIPTVSETRRFLRDASPDKRSALVNELLESPQYLANFTNFWRQVMMPEGN